MRVSYGMFVLAAGLAFACGGGENGASTSNQPAATPQQTQPPAPAAQDGAMGAPSGEIDAALASQGQGYFQSKGCVGCHTIGSGKLIGPDLKGVTDRQSLGWIIGMITNPDSMLANDDTAKTLLSEMNSQRMVPMGVTATEARALYEYLRQQGQ